MLTPLEQHIRSEADPTKWMLVVRGRPLSIDDLLTSASRTLAEFSWRGAPVAAVSAEVTGSDLDLDQILAGPRLRTRRTFVAAPVVDVIAGGHRLLATFTSPHVSIILPKYDAACARALLDLLGPERPNPYFERSRR